jgi:hypothetical protein
MFRGRGTVFRIKECNVQKERNNLKGRGVIFRGRGTVFRRKGSKAQRERNSF